MPPIKTVNRPKVEEINALLDAVRDRKTVVDVPLPEALKSKADRRRAQSLVSQVQKHYENVRSVSLRTVRTPGTILETAIDRIQKFDENLSLNNQKRTNSA